jgi:hypothetical protein
MSTLEAAANPFALMLEPEAVVLAMERSDRLGRLKSRICRPLDKPLIAHRDPDAQAHDLRVDAALDDPVSDGDCADRS